MGNTLVGRTLPGGIMPENVIHCPLCGSLYSKPFDRRKFHDRLVSNQVCSVCGLVYQSPRMTPAEMEAFYAQEYRQLYQGSEGPNPQDRAVQRGRAEALLVFARDKIGSVARHLDIGCSAGLLLKRFQKNYLCRMVGIEPGSAYRQYAQEQGLNVYASLEEMRAQESARLLSDRVGPFDLISLAHVLEHLPDPVSYLAALRQEWMRPNPVGATGSGGSGYLLIEVPNLYAHDCFEVAHQVSYSAHTLLETVRMAGFDPLALQQHGLPRSQSIPLYITLLAMPGHAPSSHRNSRSASATPVPETGVKLKRSMGMFYRKVQTRLFPQRAWLPVDRRDAS